MTTLGVPPAAVLRSRAAVLRALRGWFHDQGHVEIDAPVRVQSPALEPALEAFPVGDMWLHTSPEFSLKRVLTSGLGRVYSITPCFRDEEWGPLHSPEFTMLEWYRVGVGYEGVMEDCMQLMRAAWSALGQPHQDFEQLTVAQAYLKHTGRPAPADPIEAMRVWINDVELKLQAPTLVRDYPADQSAFACLRGPIAERFELYWRGVELGNAFTELLDAQELRERWTHNNGLRVAEGRAPYPLDPRLLDAVARHPRCGGMALGLDRLVMLLLGCDDIREVRVMG